MISGEDGSYESPKIFVHITDYPGSILWVWIGDSSAELSNLSLALKSRGGGANLQNQVNSTTGNFRCSLWNYWGSILPFIFSDEPYRIWWSHFKIEISCPSIKQTSWRATGVFELLGFTNDTCGRRPTVHAGFRNQIVPTFEIKSQYRAIRLQFQ